LLFDLVYVFALTQVTGYMAHAHSAQGVLQGLLLLALLWWTWSAYTWLGNQARADEGLLRAAMAVAMAAMFVVALTIPEACHLGSEALDLAARKQVAPNLQDVRRLRMELEPWRKTRAVRELDDQLALAG
jgi:hypothetical protein